MECRGRTQCTQATGAVPAANTTEPQQFVQPGILVIVVVIQHIKPLRQLRAFVGQLLTEENDLRREAQAPTTHAQQDRGETEQARCGIAASAPHCFSTAARCSHEVGITPVELEQQLKPPNVVKIPHSEQILSWRAKRICSGWIERFSLQQDRELGQVDWGWVNPLQNKKFTFDHPVEFPTRCATVCISFFVCKPVCQTQLDQHCTQQDEKFLPITFGRHAQEEFKCHP